MNVEKLKEIGVCTKNLEWWSEQKNFGQAWVDCGQSPLLFEVLGCLSGGVGSISRKKLVYACYECVKVALNYVTAHEERPKILMKTILAYLNNKATLEDVRCACKDATVVWDYLQREVFYYNCAGDAYTIARIASEFDAIKAVVSVGYVVLRNDDINDHASRAIFCTADAAMYAGAAVTNEIWRHTMDIVRKHYPNPPIF